MSKGFRRVFGLLGLVLLMGVQLESLLPDECDETAQAGFCVPGESGVPAPSNDGHILHACHCTHAHAVAALVPGESGASPRPAAAAGRSSELHLPGFSSVPFRPPLA